MSLGFITASSLRMLPTELRYAVADAWRHDPDAAALMRCTTDKYASRARHVRDDREALHGAGLARACRPTSDHVRLLTTRGFRQSGHRT